VKILLDENLPHQLRKELAGHEVFTAVYMGWSGVENGELLRRAAESGFDALITNDRGLEYQQNLNALSVAVLVILAPANTIEAIRPLYEALTHGLSQLQPRQFVRIGG
jgi:hypothetical protein